MAKPNPPEVGSVSRQLYSYGEVARRIVEIVGVFNPKAVTLESRLRMLKDPDVAFGVSIHAAAITGMPWSAEGEDPDVVAFVEQELRRHWFRLSRSASMAIPIGWQAFEKVWRTRNIEVQRVEPGTREIVTKRYPNAWVYDKFKQLDPATVEVLIDPQSDTWSGIRQAAGSGTVTIGAERALLWSFWKHRVFGNLYGFGITNQCYEPWYSKQAMSQYRNRYFERRSEPPYKGRGPVKVTVNGREMLGRDHMAEQLQAVKNAGLVYLPNTKTQTGEDLWDVGFLSDDKRGDMFQGVLSDLSTQILRGLLIPDRSATSGEGTGSYAQAEVHANVLASTLEDIQKEFISDVIEPQVVDPLVLYNFGPDALDKTPVRIKTGGLTNEKKQVLFEVMKAVMATDPTLPEEKQSGILRRLDLPAIAAALELPMLSASEVEEREESTETDDPENGSQDSGIDDQDEIGIPDERAIADELTQRGVLEEGN